MTRAVKEMKCGSAAIMDNTWTPRPTYTKYHSTEKVKNLSNQITKRNAEKNSSAASAWLTATERIIHRSMKQRRDKEVRRRRAVSSDSPLHVLKKKEKYTTVRLTINVCRVNSCQEEEYHDYPLETMHRVNTIGLINN